MRAARHTALLAWTAVAGGALAVALVLVDALWPLVGPAVTQRATVSPAARTTDAGIPVPSAARRCPSQPGPDTGSVHWCLPSGVSATAVARWYDDALPPGRDAGDLRWCVEQHLANGTRRELWSTGAGLVGYELPPEPPHVRTGDVGGAVAVAVLAAPGAVCPPAARSAREQP